MPQLPEEDEHPSLLAVVGDELLCGAQLDRRLPNLHGLDLRARFDHAQRRPSIPSCNRSISLCFFRPRPKLIRSLGGHVPTTRPRSAWRENASLRTQAFVSVRRTAFAKGSGFRAESEGSKPVLLEQASDVVAVAGGLPVDRCQLEQSMLGPGRQQAEDVAQVSPRLDVAEPRAREQRGEGRVN